MRRYCSARWGTRPIDTIRRRDISDLLDELVLEGRPYAARHVRAALSKLFSWCVERELVATSPAVGIKAPIPIGRRERVLNDEEIIAVWNACDIVGYPFGAYVRLLLLTGCRRAEIAESRWQDIDVQRQLLNIAGDRYKTGRPQVVPFSTLAMEVLSGLPGIQGQDFIFSTRGDRPISGFGKMKARLIGHAGVDFDLHDLRRTVRTGLSRLRVPHEIAERVLGHVQGGVAAHYDHYAYLDEKREALEAWGRHVDGLIRPSPQNIVQLR